ncbi:septal ring assembly protein ZapB [Vibrio metoecus]|uniref:Cell division protein ZapB n=1 Tax=Vibrio metoecus TaxID=1481663 RepID=A0ABR4RW58_VIBMT|nr:septal ring assembly protein ZapB [Vibrio metoecus]
MSFVSIRETRKRKLQTAVDTIALLQMEVEELKEEKQQLQNEAQELREAREALEQRAQQVQQEHAAWQERIRSLLGKMEDVE